MKLLNEKGFTLTETLIGASVLGVLTLGVMSFQASQLKQGQDTKAKANLSALKAKLLQTITNDASWAKTVAHGDSSSHLGCAGTSEGCESYKSSSYDFALYDASDTLVYSEKSSAGFKNDGSECTSGCSIGLKLQWSPSCSSGDSNCKRPLVRVKGTFYSKTSSSSQTNLEKYSFSVNRSAFQSAECATTTAPACAANEVAVCLQTGWSCQPITASSCSGAVTWSDSSTGYGSCTANVASPGIARDTNTGALTNTDSTKTGSADFRCTPGEANNGFVVQSGATCAAVATPTATATPPVFTGFVQCEVNRGGGIGGGIYTKYSMPGSTCTPIARCVTLSSWTTASGTVKTGTYLASVNPLNGRVYECIYPLSGSYAAAYHVPPINGTTCGDPVTICP